jgi:hypothetical protein
VTSLNPPNPHDPEETHNRNTNTKNGTHLAAGCVKVVLVGPGGLRLPQDAPDVFHTLDAAVVLVSEVAVVHRHGLGR